MIQDIQPKCYHNEYTPRPLGDGDMVFVFRGRQVLLRQEGGELTFPTGHDVQDKNLQYLFSIDEKAFFLSREEVPGFSFQPLFLLRKCTPQDLCFAGMTAWHLYNWYESHRFCGKCGRPLHHHPTLRAMECDCGNLEFPVIAPAVIVAVTDGDRILVSRYAGREFKGLALIAGFCEIGERAEDTVRREVMEEACSSEASSSAVTRAASASASATAAAFAFTEAYPAWIMPIISAATASELAATAA